MHYLDVVHYLFLPHANRTQRNWLNNNSGHKMPKNMGLDSCEGHKQHFLPKMVSCVNYKVYINIKGKPGKVKC